MNYKEMLQAAEAVQEVVLRDAFAIAALNGMLSRPNSHPFGESKTPEGYAIAAYKVADAMMSERVK